MEYLHERIRRLRESKNLKQADVAELVGISRVAYSQIENNVTKSITIEVGKKLSRALQVPFNELFEIEDNTDEGRTLKLENENLRSKIEELQEIIVWYFVDGFMTVLQNFLVRESTSISEQIEESAKSERLKRLISRYQEDFKDDVEMGYYTVYQYESLIKQINRSAKFRIPNLNEDIEKLVSFIKLEVNKAVLQSYDNEIKINLPESLSDIELKPVPPERKDYHKGN